MFNERAVCQSIIDSCCELAWPRERLCIQVLDDSTDKATRDLVDDKVAEWRERGVNCYALRRTNRSGYKAGAMKEGLDELADYDFVAIFDADFKPEPDFLTATVPYLIDNPEVGYVQARWTFANPNESYLTKAQEISLNYHVKCEQVSWSVCVCGGEGGGGERVVWVFFSFDSPLTNPLPTHPTPPPHSSSTSRTAPSSTSMAPPACGGARPS